MPNKVSLRSEGRSTDREARSLLLRDGDDEYDDHSVSTSPHHEDAEPQHPLRTASPRGGNATCQDRQVHPNGCATSQDRGAEGAPTSPQVAPAEGRGKRPGGGYTVYTERWYILAVYSMLAFLQSCVWNTWGPIEDTAMAVLGWDAGQIALLANWGPIMYFISAFFFSWLLHTKGLRVAILLTGGILVVGVGVRCIPVPVHLMIWTVHVGHVFIGLAGPICMAAVTSVSATWFPVNERTTATALSSTIAVLGIAASFVIGPQIVQEVKASNATTTTIPFTTYDSNSTPQYIYVTDYSDDYKESVKEIRLLMIIEFVVTALVYVAAVIYFPAAPLSPPTASAETKREDVKAGMIAILRKVSFWIPALAYGILTGAYNAWAAQITIIFQDELDQDTASWLGFYTNVVALVGGVIAARFADYLGGKMKAILLILLIAGCGSLLWTLLMVNQYIHYSTAYIFTSVILFGLFLNSTVPLFFEITVEGAFPVGEETTTMLMTWLNNVYALVFLILPMISSLNQDLGWLNWFMLGSAVICIPLMLFYKEHYNRLDLDVGQTGAAQSYGGGRGEEDEAANQQNITVQMA